MKAARVQPVPVTAVRRAVEAALAPYDDADPLLSVLLRVIAQDADQAESPAARATAVRLILELSDRLDLVPLSPGRGARPGPAAAPVEPGGGDDADRVNPFGVPDVPPGVGDGA